jgi:hypothetical protein
VGDYCTETTKGETEVVDFAGYPSLEIEGIETFTTNKGTLEVPIQGFVNVFTGEYSFSTSPTVWIGTGKLYGATGTLMFEGVQDLNTGEFVEDITGTIFVDLSPRR